MQTKLKIPKINGERIGQIIYNAIRYNINAQGTIREMNDQIGSNLYEVENDRLQEIINNYLK